MKFLAEYWIEFLAEYSAEIFGKAFGGVSDKFFREGFRQKKIIVWRVFSRACCKRASRIRAEVRLLRRARWSLSHDMRKARK